jgi:hypothetical protein
VSTANTRDCFSTFIGQRVKGVLFDALPVARRDLASGTKTLVFEDGRGLTISSKGTYWVESVRDVQRAIRQQEKALSTTMDELAGVLQLAGLERAS